MAVAGRKAETKGSTIGTSLIIPHNCGPCEIDKDHVEAYGYCVECQDYLCKVCFKSHGKNKASRHHRLLSNDEISTADVSNLPTDTYTEICTRHKKEYIKFFCPEHIALGCNDCMTLNHRACAIDYIPDKCKGISDSSEYKTTVSTLAQDLEAVNAHIVKVNVKDGISENMHDQCIKEIDNFQAQINERIDQLRRHIQNAAEEYKSQNKEDIRKVKNALQETKSRLEKAECDMNKHKATNQEGQLFISIKKAKSVLSEKGKNMSQIAGTNENMLYKFEPSCSLESLLTESDIFGKLSPQTLESVQTLEPVVNGIVVLNVPKDVTRDVVTTYFEDARQSQGGETVTVDVHADENYCLVSFKDHTVVPRVCEKGDHTISGRHVDIHSCNEFLGIPYSFTLDNYDPTILRYFKGNESKQSQIEKELPKHANILWSENPVRVQLLFEHQDKCLCSCLRSWKKKVKKLINRYINALSIKIVAISDAAWDDVVKALVGVKVTSPDEIAICLDRTKNQVNIICENGHAETDVHIIIETMRSCVSSTEN